MTFSTTGLLRSAGLAVSQSYLVAYSRQPPAGDGYWLASGEQVFTSAKGSSAPR
jgi:hypothetical protein